MATTFRKVQRESGAGSESEKVKLKIAITVESVDFDPEGQHHQLLLFSRLICVAMITANTTLPTPPGLLPDGALVAAVQARHPGCARHAGLQIRLSGRNLTENEHIKLGAYHTLEIELQRAFSLAKAAWDGLDLERIREACDPAAQADLAVLLITVRYPPTSAVPCCASADFQGLQHVVRRVVSVSAGKRERRGETMHLWVCGGEQEGLANLCLVGGSLTVVRAKVESNLPRKRGAAASGYDKAMDTFCNKALQAVLRHVDWAVVKCLVVAGPGFAKDKFKEYLDAEAVRQDIRCTWSACFRCGMYLGLGHWGLGACPVSHLRSGCKVNCRACARQAAHPEQAPHHHSAGFVSI